MKNTWDLSLLYKDEEEFEKDFVKFSNVIPSEYCPESCANVFWNPEFIPVNIEVPSKRLLIIYLLVLDYIIT